MWKNEKKDVKVMQTKEQKETNAKGQTTRN
jgi:hypothetical protein